MSDEFLNKYIIQLADKSYCPECKQNVKLLIYDGIMNIEGPMFYICFKCSKVYEVGIGEVPDLTLVEKKDG